MSIIRCDLKKISVLVYEVEFDVYSILHLQAVADPGFDGRGSVNLS